MRIQGGIHTLLLSTVNLWVGFWQRWQNIYPEKIYCKYAS